MSITGERFAALAAHMDPDTYDPDNATAAGQLQAETAIRPRSYSATTRSLMADLGPTLADQIIAKLEAAASADSIISRTLSLLAPAEGGIDLAHPATQAQLAQLVTAGVLLQSDADALLALTSETYHPWADVTAEDVANVRRRAG